MSLILQHLAAGSDHNNAVGLSEAIGIAVAIVIGVSALVYLIYYFTCGISSYRPVRAKLPQPKPTKVDSSEEKIKLESEDIVEVPPEGEQISKPTSTYMELTTTGDDENNL